MKEEAYDFLEEHTIKDLVKKYSQFINFPIQLWTSKTESVEEAVEPEQAEAPKEGETDDDVKVEDEDDEKPKTKMVRYILNVKLLGEYFSLVCSLQYPDSVCSLYHCPL